MLQAVAAAAAHHATGGEELVTLREAARRTGVQASTVQRYAARYPELMAEIGGQKLLRFAAYQAHREDSLAVAASPPATKPEAPRRVAANAARGRHEEAKAQLAELELAAKRGELVARTEIESLVVEVLTQLKAEMLRADVDLAERVRVAANAREAASVLLERDRALLTRVADRFEAA
jgi:hypothetical protein